MIIKSAQVAKSRFPNRPWLPEDDQLLRELADAKRRSREIAKQLRRTLASVRYRARRINVRLTHESQASTEW